MCSLMPNPKPPAPFPEPPLLKFFSLSSNSARREDNKSPEEEVRTTVAFHHTVAREAKPIAARVADRSSNILATTESVRQRTPNLEPTLEDLLSLGAADGDRGGDLLVTANTERSDSQARLGKDGGLPCELLEHTRGACETIAALADADVQAELVHLKLAHGVRGVLLGGGHGEFVCATLTLGTSSSTLSTGSIQAMSAMRSVEEGNTRPNQSLELLVLAGRRRRCPKLKIYKFISKCVQLRKKRNFLDLCHQPRSTFDVIISSQTQLHQCDSVIQWCSRMTPH